MKPENKWSKILLTTLCFFVILDLIYLNYQILLKKSDVETKVQDEVTETNNFSLRTDDQELTLNEIKALINEATQSIVLESSTFEETPVTSSPKTVTNTSVTENYIPLGTGSTSSTTWTELPGVEAYLAPSNFGTITGIYFEAALRIPNGTGTAYARLKNVTDNVGLFESEVAKNGETAGLVSSGKIPVPNTTKLYRVEMKSSLGSTAILDNARIKIFVQNQ